MKTTILSVFAIGAQITATMPAYAVSNVMLALAIVETGAKPGTDTQAADAKIGRAGEVSRYQFKLEYVTPRELKVMPDDKSTVGYWIWSEKVAERILSERAGEFLRKHSRVPDMRETYILWNAPAYLLYREAKYWPVPDVVEKRAAKFVKAWEKLTGVKNK